jgi:ferrochelatase
MPEPFDAVLLVAFGGPQGMDDIRPFLGNVLRGRRVSPERVEEVAKHYEHFGGVSPLTAVTLRQADGLRTRLAQRGLPLPVYVGMRNWHPLLPETLASMSRDGVRSAIGFLCSAYRSYSGCGQYRENVRDAQAGLAGAGLPGISVTYVDDWHGHEKFIDANARHVREAISALPEALRPRARLVFTAHSIPTSMAAADRYVAQLRQAAGLIAERLGRSDWALVFQSRSGRPGDPWLEPDVCDYLRAERAKGLEAVVLSPIGFICDHIEVLFDLDEEAARVCRDIGLAMTRAQTVNDDPQFVEMMADVVQRVWERYRTGRPLTIVPPALPGTARGPR